MIKEELLQFIWKTGIFQKHALKTTCGKKLSILSPGTQNFNAGPDFFNAKIIIENIIWAGNVEVHPRSSDWEKHGHHLNGAYNNVILHVIEEEDADTLSSLGRSIPHLQLSNLAPQIPFFRSLLENESWLPCHTHIHSVSDVLFKHWLTLLYNERMGRKCHYVSNLLFISKGRWEDTLCQVLASAFGIPLNSLPFQMTLSRIPFELLVQNRDNLQLLEAVLFGQAGFLDMDHLTGPYDQDLYNIYLFHRSKFSKRPVDQYMWKFLRLRPASFPTLRISQFASLLHIRQPLLDTVLEFTSLAEAEQCFRVESSAYWDTHYLFGKCSPESKKVLGHQSILTLIINGLVPFLFSYGSTMNHFPAIKLGNKFLGEIESESNQIIKKWATFGIVPNGAFESQALIQLHNFYCKQKRCLDCQLGVSFIERANHEKK